MGAILQPPAKFWHPVLALQSFVGGALSEDFSVTFNTYDVYLIEALIIHEHTLNTVNQNEYIGFLASNVLQACVGRTTEIVSGTITEYAWGANGIHIGQQNQALSSDRSKSGKVFRLTIDRTLKSGINFATLEGYGGLFNTTASPQWFEGGGRLPTDVSSIDEIRLAGNVYNYSSESRIAVYGRNK